MNRQWFRYESDPTTDTGSNMNFKKKGSGSDLIKIGENLRKKYDMILHNK